MPPNVYEGRTNAVLLTIHAYQSSLGQIVDSVERARRLFNVEMKGPFCDKYMMAQLTIVMYM
jgi:hypothetical protein